MNNRRNTLGEQSIMIMKLALAKALAESVDIIISVRTGDSAVAFAKLANESNFRGKIVAVTHDAWGLDPDPINRRNELTDENRKILLHHGIIILTSSDVSFDWTSLEYEAGVFEEPADLIINPQMSGVGWKSNQVFDMSSSKSNTEALKVCINIASFALAANAVNSTHPVVSIGGAHDNFILARFGKPGNASTKTYQQK